VNEGVEVQIQKLQPKLRMVANGSTEVNAIRAEHAAAVAVPAKPAEAVGALRTQEAVPVERTTLPKSVTRGHLREAPDAYVSIFVQLADDLADAPLPRGLEGATARKANLVTVELPVERAVALERRGGVAYVELGQPLAAPTPTVSQAPVRRPSLAERRFGDGRRHNFGQDVLIGLIDVGGFDFAHPDFLDGDGQTRFERIWDQGGDTHPPPGERGTSSFGYGSELRREEMNGAIEAAHQGPGALPAHVLEPQSQMVEGSHGTHVASIAAGNRGICRGARIAGVLIAILESEEERRLSFYDSTRLAHAFDYLLALAHELGDLPVSINISLGTNGHAHDDSSPIGRWIDAALVRSGRSVSVAAGNAGQERPEQEGDIGFVIGRVHSSGHVQARELVGDIEWNVVGNGIADLSENELEIWYGPQDRFGVQVKPPGQPWSDVIAPGQFVENRQLPDGSFLSVYNELYHPANGCNYIAIYLSPLLREPGVVGVTAGQWIVRLVGLDVRDGRYHCWIERDDPRRVGRIGEREAWVFPSFFSEHSFVDRSTVSSLACGQRIVSVANLDEQNRRIHITSSQGPTRDGREKPDIAAPGAEIVAAKGFADGDAWVAMTGTSMASPHVAGLTGLMLAINPRLTGAQIGGIIKRTARPLPGSDFSWRDDAGAGAIDPERCLEEAAAMLTREDVT
jgi:subtilisin family serine protease